MKLRNAVNPIFIFILIWLAIAGLLETQFSYILEEIEYDFGVFFIGVLISILAGYIVAVPLKKRYRQRGLWSVDTVKLEQITKKMMLWWGAISVIEIIYSGGVPLVWIIQGVNKTYFDFGINGLHGFANALYCIFLLNNGYLYLVMRKKKYLIILVLLLCWPIIVVTRALLMMSILENIILFVMFSNMKLKIIIRVCIIGLIIVLLFGYIGDFRSNGMFDFYELAQIKYEWMRILPSGVIWVLMYVTTPLSNIQNIFYTVTPNGNLDLTLGTLLPTPIRNVLFEDMGDKTYGIINQAFNVSSYMDPFYKDYGSLYVIIFTFIIGFISRFVFVNLLNSERYEWVMTYCILCMMLILSTFVNSFLSLPFLFQIVLVQFLGRYFSLNKSKVGE